MNISLLLMAGLLTFSMGEGYYPENLPGYSPAVYWGLGIVTALLFFISILWHEMAHALMAQYFGIPVRRIVLFILGGMAEIEREAEKAYQEFWIALIGPLSSVLLGGMLLGAGWLASATAPLAVMLSWIGIINLLLAGFNMLPGFPLDGGRVFRSLLWLVSGKFLRSTRIATRTGQAFGAIFFFGAPFEYMVSGNAFGSIWWLFIGWFLWTSARNHYQFAKLQAALRDVPVGSVIRHRLTLERDWSLMYAMDMMKIHGARNTVPVVQDNEYVGVFSLDGLVGIPGLSWGMLRVGHLMKSLAGAPIITAETDLFDTLRQMELQDADYIVITQDTAPIGVLGRDELLRFAERRHRMVAV